MRLTAKSEYGLLAVIDLAMSAGDGPVAAREVSERRAIPARFLEQLLVSLRRAGIVSAVRGARGGFVLSRPADQITALDVVEALEGPLAASVCDSERGELCGQAGACAAAPLWAKATAALREVFQSATIADLAGAQSRFDDASGIAPSERT